MQCAHFHAVKLPAVSYEFDISILEVCIYESFVSEEGPLFACLLPDKRGELVDITAA